MATTDTPKPIKAPAEPKVKIVQVNPETFDLICKALFNQSTETLAMARDIAELRLSFSQVGLSLKQMADQLSATLAGMGEDLRAVAAAHKGHPGFRQEQAPPVDIDTLAKRLDEVEQLPRVLRAAK